MDTDGRGRVFVLLQGPYSEFFAELAAALRRTGADVRRVLFCPGDRLFWRGPGAISFRGRQDEWRGWIEAFLRAEGATDVAMLGDGRRLHDEAAQAARALGLRVHVVELGYLRPGWLTLEPDGTGGRSRFPRDWAGIAALAEGAPEPPAPRFAASFLEYAAKDVAFNLANLLAAWATFPHYRRHSTDHPVTEWSGWIWNRFMRAPARARALKAAEARIAAHEGSIFFLPLQLDADFQMRLHAPPGGVAALMERTIRSFAAHAPAEALLAVKVHPLDHLWAGWRRKIDAAAREAGVAARCLYLDGGDLDAMLPRAAGVVVANSTVGLSALRAGAPVIALGTAIYDLPGLTFQHGLDRFWREAEAPDPARLDLFLRALAASIQLPGGFDGEGVKPGAAAMAARMLAPPPWPSREAAA